MLNCYKRDYINHIFSELINMSKKDYVFSFEVKKNNKKIIEKLCYCHGDIYGSVCKSGAMNLIRSPFLVDTFLMITKKLSDKYNLHIVSNMDSILSLNLYLVIMGKETIVNIIDIDSCSVVWNLTKSNETIVHDYKKVFKKYIDNIFRYPQHHIFLFTKNELDNLEKEKLHMLLQGMSYAIDCPLDASRIISERNQSPYSINNINKMRYVEGINKKDN
ncbi:putative orfan [Tupanvirus soda lake]|uniref:Orfan n=2 Tax=Tupanvirus TaxID=2094720 RepID=A0AC62AAQ5_9VIRU|nr:putative orfan [Tupanvirus soda lake]QKU34725.1 putative orfan [Tupanvirus soda lake]